MSSFSKISTFIVRKIWTAAAILLVLFAVLMSLLRYSLPYMDDKKQYFEHYISSEYGIDVNIQQLSASWQGKGPSLVLENVQLERQNQSPVSVTIEQIFVEIDFWMSIRTLSLVSKEFSLDGVNLLLNLDKMNTSKNNVPIVDALRRLFLEQLQSFSLVDSQLTILIDNVAHRLEIENIAWLNRGRRHQGTGLIRNADLSKNSVAVVIDLLGNSDNYDGVIYAKGDALDLSPWINEIARTDVKLSKSEANIEFWATIENQQIIDINGLLSKSFFTWEIPSGDSVDSNLLSGNFRVAPNNNEWIFNINDLVFQIDEQNLVTNWLGHISQTGTFSLQSATSIPIGSLSGIGTIALNEDSLQILNTLSPEGSIDNLYIRSNEKGISAYTEISNVSVNPYSKIPGVSGIDIEFWWLKNTGKMNIQGQNIPIAIDNLLHDNLVAKDINLTLGMQTSPSFTLSLGPSLIELDDVNISPQLYYDYQADWLTMHLGLSTMQVNKVSTYLPTALMSHQTISFLTSALKGRGTVNDAQILWFGQPRDFPFEQNEGVFQAKLTLDKADFAFSSSWPALSNLDLDLLFENQGLSMSSSSSQLGDVLIDNMKASIPYLGKGAVLSIDAIVAADAKTASDLFLNSSLSSTLGEVLANDILLTKAIKTALNIRIPLEDETATVVRGDVVLNNNKLSIPSVGLQLVDVTGTLSFVNEKIKIENLQAMLLEQPVLVNIDAGNADNKYSAKVQVAGKWQLSPLLQNVDESLSEYLLGLPKWKADVNLDFPKNGFNYEATLTSLLENVESTLPAPFYKSFKSKMPLHIKASGNLQASSISATLGTNIKFDGNLPHKELQFSRAHLALGPTDFVGLGAGFSISAKLDEVNVVSWYSSLSKLLSGTKSSKKPIFKAPERIFIEADSLIIADQKANNVDITVKQDNNDWTLDISAKQAKAKVILFDDWFNKGIEVDASYINLESWTKSDITTNKIIPQDIPNLNIYCRQCSFIGNDLGEIKLKTTRNFDGMKIDEFSSKTVNGEVNVSGQWFNNNNQHYTFIDGKLSSPDFGAFLNAFKFDSGIKDSSADMLFSFTWKNSPADFAFDDLNGEVKWALSDGYITELDDKGSRIFTLLSFDSLLRKLSFDFRDVFAKGFFYNEMSGSLQVTDGRADTRDTEIDGGAGEMEIYGYTDLVTKELNYNVSFAPNVTGNLPILIYFMVNPPTALAALALDQVLTSAKVISNINYSITGTINEPIMLETGRNSTEVDLPSRREAVQIEQEDSSFIPPTKADIVLLEPEDG